MSLTDVAIDKIREMIVQGRLAPGDRLPREADLAEDLGISRSSLREAVRALSLVGVLDVRQGDGTYVTSLEPEILLQSVAFLSDFHTEAGVLHLFGVRRILEPAAAELAALSMPDDDATALVTFADLAASGMSIEELVANDLEFHHRIAVASGNPVLASLVDGLSGPTRRARIWRGLTDGDAVARTLREHHAIAAAIRDRQPALARSWATVHIAGVEDWLRAAATPGDLVDPVETDV